MRIKLAVPRNKYLRKEVIVIFCLLLAGIIFLANSFNRNDSKVDNVDEIVKFNKTAKTNISIIVGSNSQTSQISPYVYGVNDVWYDNGYGSANPITEKPYKELTKDTRDIGINIIRYPGGNPSDTFHWEQALGPIKLRQAMVVNSGAVKNGSAALPSKFGPAEFNNLLTSTGSAGNITVNFGTGTAAEAADWVCYETAPYPDPSDPACNQYSLLRVKSGHTQPMNIPYWEVGNEPYVDQYWRDGKVISSPGNCHTGQYQCLYVYGGTTRFTNEQLHPLATQVRRKGGVGPMKYYVPNPPILKGSFKLNIKGQTWHQISYSDLQKSSARAHVYSLDLESGQIQFPHNNIPHPNDNVLASYVSGPHDGFIDFYNAMKKANPNIKVCESYSAPTTLQLLGTNHPYDCYAQHDYALIGGSDQNSYTDQQFHNQTMLDTVQFSNRLQAIQDEIKQYSGKNIPIVMTEYGVINYQDPVKADLTSGDGFKGGNGYHSSVDSGLFVGNMLMSIIKAGLPMAAKHYLVGYNLSSIPGVNDGIDTYDFSSNAMISTSYPNCAKGDCRQPMFVLQPAAYIFQMFSKLSYDQLVPSNVVNDPQVNISKVPNNNPFALTGSYSRLNVLATKDNKGHESIIVINNSIHEKVTANVTTPSSYSQATAWTVGGDYLSYNIAARPYDVKLHQTKIPKTNSLTATFPPSSVTILNF